LVSCLITWERRGGETRSSHRNKEKKGGGKLPRKAKLLIFFIEQKYSRKKAELLFRKYAIDQWE
jgi:hypothetical protein